MSVLTSAVTALEASFGLAAPPTICAIEFAMDFYLSPGSTDREGKELAARLARRLYTGDRRPRQVGGGTNNATVFVGGDVEIVADATTYYGHRTDDVHHKVYWKEKDCGLFIPPAARRARVEVRVSGDALLGMGLRQIRDLGAANLRKLLSPQFRFRHVRHDFDEEPGTACYGLMGRAGISESRGMASFEGFRRTRRGRKNKYPRVLAADRFMTRRVGDALDGLTMRLTKKVGAARGVWATRHPVVSPMASVIDDYATDRSSLLTTSTNTRTDAFPFTSPLKAV